MIDPGAHINSDDWEVELMTGIGVNAAYMQEVDQIEFGFPEMGVIALFAREYGEPREINPITGGLLLIMFACFAFQFIHKPFAMKDPDKAPTLHRAAVLTQRIGLGFFILMGLISIGRGLYAVIFN